MKIPKSERTQSISAEVGRAIAPINITSAVPEAIGGLGRELGRIGEDIGKRQVEQDRIQNAIKKQQDKLQKEQDQNDALDAYIGLRDDIFIEENSLKERQGKDAIGITKEAATRYQTTYDKRSNALSDGARLRLKELSHTHRSSFLKEMATQEAGQKKVYEASIEAGFVANALTEVRANPLDMGRFDAHIARVGAAVDRVHRGKDVEYREGLKAEYSLSMRKAQLDGAKDQGLGVAEIFIEQNREAIGEPLANKYLKEIAKEKKIVEKDEKSKQEADEKQAHIDEEREIGDLFLAKDYTGAYKRVQNSILLTGDEKKTWGTAIDSAVEGKGKEADPYKNSDDKFATKFFKECAEGLHNPEDIVPIVGKLNRADARYARQTATMALAPERQALSKMIESAVKEGKDKILGSNYLYMGAEDVAIKQAGEFERSFRRTILDAEDDETRFKMLDEKSKDYILPRLLKGFTSPEYTLPDGQPDLSPLWIAPGSKPLSGINSKPVKNLWGEK